MPRPPKQPKLTEFNSPEDREAYRAAIRRYTGGPVPDEYDLGEYFGALMTSPPLCAIAGEMGQFVRTAGDRDNSYTHAQREFVDQVLSADWNTNVVQMMHIPDALSAGVRIEAIEALRYGHEEHLNEDERLHAKYIRQVVSGTVDDLTWSAMEKSLGIRGVIELTGFILWLQWIMRMMQALKTSDPPDEEIDQLISDLRSGRRAIPDYRERIR